MTWREERAAEARAKAGLPVLRCPNCGRILADRWSGHYEPPELGGHAGRYTCRPSRDRKNP